MEKTRREHYGEEREQQKDIRGFRSRLIGHQRADALGKQAQEDAPPNYLFEQSRQQVINSANKANEPENETETLSINATKAIMNLF